MCVVTRWVRGSSQRPLSPVRIGRGRRSSGSLCNFRTEISLNVARSTASQPLAGAHP